MRRPASPLPIHGRLPAQTSPVHQFLASINPVHSSAAITRLDEIQRIALTQQQALLERGAALRVLAGARVLYRPAIPTRASNARPQGLTNATLIEITRARGTWMLSGAKSCQCLPGTPEYVHFSLPAAAIGAILHQALQDTSLVPGAETPIDIRRFLSDAPDAIPPLDA